MHSRWHQTAATLGWKVLKGCEGSCCIHSSRNSHVKVNIQSSVYDLLCLTMSLKQDIVNQSVLLLLWLVCDNVKLQKTNQYFFQWIWLSHEREWNLYKCITYYDDGKRLEQAFQYTLQENPHISICVLHCIPGFISRWNVVIHFFDAPVIQ